MLRFSTLLAERFLLGNIFDKQVKLHSELFSFSLIQA